MNFHFIKIYYFQEIKPLLFIVYNTSVYFLRLEEEFNDSNIHVLN